MKVLFTTIQGKKPNWIYNSIMILCIIGIIIG